MTVRDSKMISENQNFIRRLVIRLGLGCLFYIRVQINNSYLEQSPGTVLPCFWDLKDNGTIWTLTETSLPSK